MSGGTVVFQSSTIHDNNGRPAHRHNLLEFKKKTL